MTTSHIRALSRGRRLRAHARSRCHCVCVVCFVLFFRAFPSPSRATLGRGRTRHGRPGRGGKASPPVQRPGSRCGILNVCIRLPPARPRASSARWRHSATHAQFFSFYFSPARAACTQARRGTRPRNSADNCKFIRKNPRASPRRECPACRHAERASKGQPKSQRCSHAVFCGALRCALELARKLMTPSTERPLAFRVVFPSSRQTCTAGARGQVAHVSLVLFCFVSRFECNTSRTQQVQLDSNNAPPQGFYRPKQPPLDTLSSANPSRLS
jgi:hypothetical protein